MNKQNKKKIFVISFAAIATISVVLNVFLIRLCNKLINQVKNNENQVLNNNEGFVDNIDKNEEDNINNNEIVEIEEKEEPEKECIYKYIEGKERQVIVEKEVEKIVEVPATSTDAIVTYIDVEGSTKIIELPSGTTINFSAGEHGTYDSIPSPITLTDNQELDITDSSYNPSSVEVNYIFKGFSYSGDTMTCVYSLASNTVNVEHKQIANSIIKNNVVYVKHEYLESTGTQYIDTGITFNASDYTGEIVFQYTVATSNTWLFGAVNNSYVGCEAGLSSGGVFYSEAGFTYSQNNTSLKTTGTFTTSAFSPSNNNFYLFARNAPTLANVKAKVFSCKIKKGTSPILDLVPAERISDKKLGMLDQLSGTFLVNKESGNFICPDDIVLVPGISAGRVIASGTYESSSSLTIAAIANDGYRFVKWSDGITNATRIITVGSETVYTALFVPNN